MSQHDQPANPNRRKFFATVGATAGTLALGSLTTRAYAQAAPLKETDSLAMSMGYKEDTTKVDAKKYPNHKADQTCANCQFYQGKAGDAAGPCQLFPGKTVNAKGWCQVWALKK